MKRVADAIAVALVCLFFSGMAYRLWWDLSHPEEWAGRAPGNHPYIYGPACGIAALLYIYVAWYIFRNERRIKQRRAKLARLLILAEELLRQERWREAEPILKECERLSKGNDN